MHSDVACMDRTAQTGTGMATGAEPRAGSGLASGADGSALAASAVALGVMDAPLPRPQRAMVLTPAGVPDEAELLRRVTAELGSEQVERYLLGQARLVLERDATQNPTLKVLVHSSFLGKTIERRFGVQLARAAGVGLERVRVEVDRGAMLAANANAAATRAAAQATHAVGGMPSSASGRAGTTSPARPANARPGLDAFIEGDSNRLALMAVRRVVEQGRGASGTERDGGGLSRVFLYGGCGLGKTHLLQGAVQAFGHGSGGGGGRAKYVTGEDFTNQYITAVRAGKMEQFRKLYRGLDLLCLDDVQFLARKEGTQAELLHTLDAIATAGTRVIFASEHHPHAAQAGVRGSAGPGGEGEAPVFGDKLTSRFLACCVVQVEAPDPLLRRKLVKHLAGRRGLLLTDDAVELLALRSERAVGSLGGFGGSVREIDGLVNQVDAVWRLLGAQGEANGGALDATGVRRALGIEDRLADMARAGQRSATARSAPTVGGARPVPIRKIIEHVCTSLCVEAADFRGKGRHPRVVLARAIVSRLSRELTTMSFPEIARAMGRTNHSTIITAYQRLEQQLETSGQTMLDAGLAPRHAGITLAGLVGTLGNELRRMAV